MILKIRNPKSKSWWIYDGITRIHYGAWYGEEIYSKVNIINKDEVEPIKFFRKDLYSLNEAFFEIFPDIHLFNCEKKCPGEKYFLHWASFAKDENTEPRLVVFDTEAYICNDSGKTIEIIR